jgi:hypothetical protein
MEEIRNGHKSLIGKHEKKRPRGRYRRRWEHNFKETGWEGVDWMHLAQDRDL